MCGPNLILSPPTRNYLLEMASNAQLAFVTGASSATNEMQVMPHLMSSHGALVRKQSRWLTLSGASSSTSLTVRDFGKQLLIDTQLANSVTHTIVVPAASISAGASLEFFYKTASAPLSTSSNIIVLASDTTTSQMNGLVAVGGSAAFVAGDGLDTQLSMPLLLIGSSFKMDCDGKEWWVQGNILATTPAFS